MKNSNKKGFTIVELVIVIAVIAILAAVLIPTFSSLIKKANLSADQQAVRNMNTAAAIGAAEGKYENPSDVIDALYANGFNLGKMKTYSNGFHYAYNFEENKVYLLDENDNVIYPEETSKDKLWGLYDNTNSGLLDGVTKYIAMANITGLTVFNTDTQYEIDLYRHYVDIEGSYTNITLKNGGIVNGSFTLADDIVTYTKYVPTEDYTVTGTFANMVFDSYVFTDHNDQRFVEAKFENCIFYDSSLRTEGNVEFVNCEFVGTAASGSAIDIYDGSSNTASYTVKITGCTFNGGYRAINTSGQDDNTNTKIDIIIDGCEFNAVGAEKGIIQIARINQTVTIKNTTFNALGQSKGIISLHGTILEFAGVSAEAIINQFTFSNNTINEDIPVEQYVFWRSEVSNEYSSVDDTITNMMK